MKTRKATNLERMNFKRWGIVLEPIRFFQHGSPGEPTRELWVGYYVPTQKCWVKKLLKRCQLRHLYDVNAAKYTRAEAKALALSIAKNSGRNNAKAIRKGLYWQLEAW